MPFRLLAFAPLLLAVVLALACVRADAPVETVHAAEARCSVVDDPRCANPIDALVIPQLQRRGLEPEPAPRHELCRRLAIDIFGRAPTDAERERCLQGSTEAIVDAWLDSREYVLHERRVWATRIDYDATYVWPKIVEDLDRLVGRLAADDIRYQEFAGRVAMHPAFYARHPDTDWFRAIFDLFLGRSARPDEVDELLPLVAVWGAREFTDERRPEQFFLELGLSTCACKNTGGCRSSALGRTIDFGTSCRRGAELVRTIAVSPGTTESEERFIDPYAGRGIAPLPKASEEEARGFRGLGEALAARLDFHEAAVDRELRRLLGWWQSSFNQPATDLPRVRAALAEQLRASGSIRELHRTILTSVLYTTAAAGDADAPPWSSGPRKLLAVEAWVDSAAAAVGRALPRCDHRFVPSTQLAMYEQLAATYGEPQTVEARDELDFLHAARSMGGSCRMTPVQRPSIGGLEAQRALAVRLCAEGDAVLPPDFDPTRLGDASDHLVQRILGRPSTAQERDVLVGDMQACLARPDRGCAEPEQAVRWTCVRLLTSVEFGSY